MSMPKTSVRIAMLGSGFVAGFYMQGLANVGSQEVVANYSKKKHRARKFAQEWSIPEPTAELNKLIERDDIDLYVIAAQNEEHLPVSLALSRAKRNQVSAGSPTGLTERPPVAPIPLPATTSSCNGCSAGAVTLGSGTCSLRSRTCRASIPCGRARKHAGGARVGNRMGKTLARSRRR
jgi:hypothetical protein